MYLTNQKMRDIIYTVTEHKKYFKQKMNYILTKGEKGSIMKLFKVTAKCGHVGKNFYTVKNFPVKANDGKEAAKAVRLFPRVKHDQKDAILNVVKIDDREFEYLIHLNNEDPYFSCANVQEQRLYDEIRFAEENPPKRLSETSRKEVYIGKKLLRCPKKYIRNYYMEREAI